MFCMRTPGFRGSWIPEGVQGFRGFRDFGHIRDFGDSGDFGDSRHLGHFGHFGRYRVFGVFGPFRCMFSVWCLLSSDTRISSVRLDVYICCCCLLCNAFAYVLLLMAIVLHMTPYPHDPI